MESELLFPETTLVWPWGMGGCLHWSQAGRGCPSSLPKFTIPDSVGWNHSRLETQLESYTLKLLQPLHGVQ